MKFSELYTSEALALLKPRYTPYRVEAPSKLDLLRDFCQSVVNLYNKSQHYNRMVAQTNHDQLELSAFWKNSRHTDSNGHLTEVQENNTQFTAAVILEVLKGTSGHLPYGSLFSKAREVIEGAGLNLSYLSSTMQEAIREYEAYCFLRDKYVSLSGLEEVLSMVKIMSLYNTMPYIFFRYLEACVSYNHYGILVKQFSFCGNPSDVTTLVSPDWIPKESVPLNNLLSLKYELASKKNMSFNLYSSSFLSDFIFELHTEYTLLKFNASKIVITKTGPVSMSVLKDDTEEIPAEEFFTYYTGIDELKSLEKQVQGEILSMFDVLLEQNIPEINSILHQYKIGADL